MENAVLFEVNNGVATITLNRPDRYNAVNQDLVDGISNSLKKCEADQSIRAVVITGAGRGFCAGADMSVFGDEVTADQRSQYIIDQYQPLMNQSLLMSLFYQILQGQNAKHLLWHQLLDQKHQRFLNKYD